MTYVAELSDGRRAIVVARVPEKVEQQIRRLLAPDVKDLILEQLKGLKKTRRGWPPGLDDLPKLWSAAALSITDGKGHRVLPGEGQSQEEARARWQAFLRDQRQYAKSGSTKSAGRAETLKSQSRQDARAVNAALNESDERIAQMLAERLRKAALAEFFAETSRRPSSLKRVIGDLRRVQKAIARLRTALGQLPRNLLRRVRVTNYFGFTQDIANTAIDLAEAAIEARDADRARKLHADLDNVAKLAAGVAAALKKQSGHAASLLDATAMPSAGQTKPITLEYCSVPASVAVEDMQTQLIAAVTAIEMQITTIALSGGRRGAPKQPLKAAFASAARIAYIVRTGSHNRDEIRSFVGDLGKALEFHIGSEYQTISKRKRHSRRLRERTQSATTQRRA